MSARRFSWERLVLACTLPPTTKLVALALATHADADGSHAHPGQDRLARECGIQPRAVRRHLDALAALELVVRTFRGSSAGRAGRADVYRLNAPAWLPAGTAPDDWRPRPGADPEHRFPGTGDTGPDHRHPRAGDREKNTGPWRPNTGPWEQEHRSPGTAHHVFTSPNTTSPYPLRRDGQPSEEAEEEDHASLPDVLAAVAAAWPQLGRRDLEKLRPAIAAALLELGSSQLVKHLTGNTDGAKHPASIMWSRLDNLPTSRRPPAVVPWCGECSASDHRWLDDLDPPRPCPDCSPQAAAKAAKPAAADGDRVRAAAAAPDGPGRTPAAAHLAPGLATHIAPGDPGRAEGLSA